MFRALLPSFVILMMCASAMAAPEQQVIKSDNPHIQKAQDKAVDIAKSFTPVEIENLSVIKDGFGIIRAVKVTDTHVSAAVKQCGKDNPEMKTSMDAEYNDWNSGVVTTLNGKEKEMKAAINDGRFSKPKDVTAFLALLDSAAKYADDKMEKKIISTPSACESLQESMEDTAKTLEQMMAELKFPIAVPKKGPAAQSTAPGAHD